MEPLNPEQLDASLNSISGATEPATAGVGSDADPTAAFLVEARDALRQVQAPAPSAQLSEFLGVHTPGDVGVPAAGIGSDVAMPVGASSSGGFAALKAFVSSSADRRLSRLITNEPAAALSRGPAARERSEQERQNRPEDLWARTIRAVSRALVGAAALLAVAGAAQIAGVVDLLPGSKEPVVEIATQANESSIAVAAQPDVTGDEVVDDFRVSADDAGSVVLFVEDGKLFVNSVAFGEGWVYEVERRSGRSVEVVFANGSGARVELEAEIDGGTIQVEIEDSRAPLPTVLFLDAQGNVVDPPAQAPTPTTAPLPTTEPAPTVEPTTTPAPSLDDSDDDSGDSDDNDADDDSDDSDDDADDSDDDESDDDDDSDDDESDDDDDADDSDDDSDDDGDSDDDDESDDDDDDDSDDDE